MDEPSHVNEATAGRRRNASRSRSRSRRRSRSRNGSAINHSNGHTNVSDSGPVAQTTVEPADQHDDSSSARASAIPASHRPRGGQSQSERTNVLDTSSQSQERNTHFENLIGRFASLFEDSQMPAAPSNAALQQIRNVTFEGDFASNLRQDAQCVICCSDFDAGETLEELPGCEHVFHGSCIRRWFTRTSSCPICRRLLSAAGEGVCPGVCVRVVGLSGSRQEFNGSQGTCLRRSRDDECWVIRRDDAGSDMQIKKDNLEVIKQLTTGSLVRVVNLVGAVHLNGVTGHCMTFDCDAGRWGVHLATRPTAERKAIKPQNLELIAQARNAEGFVGQVMNVIGDSSSLQELANLSQHMLEFPEARTQMQPMFERLLSDPSTRNLLQDLPGGSDVIQQLQRMAWDPSQMQHVMRDTLAEISQVSGNHRFQQNMRQIAEGDNRFHELFTRIVGNL